MCLTKSVGRYVFDKGQVGVLFIDGILQGAVQPGCHAFWQGTGKIKMLMVDIRECMLDIEPAVEWTGNLQGH